MAGALLASRLPARPDQRHRLAAGYVMQAFGFSIGVAWPTEAGFEAGSLLLGLPFTALTFFMLQEVRRIRPLTAASTIGMVTAVWAIGQALGPPMVAALLRQSGGDAHKPRSSARSWSPRRRCWQVRRSTWPRHEPSQQRLIPFYAPGAPR